MSQTSHRCVACVSRRALLTAAVGSAGVVLAGCASYGDAPAAAPVAAGAGSATPPPDAPAATTPPAAGSPAASAAAAPGGVRLAALADVPVGGGIVLADQDIVLTQPTEGTVVAFSATCTHAGCAVNEVSDGLIRCPCHGSEFDAATGEPTAGPAASPLPPVIVTVSGGDVLLA